MTTLNLNNAVDTSGNGRSLVFASRSAASLPADPFGIGQPGLTFDGTTRLVGQGSQWNLPSGSYTLRGRLKRLTGHNSLTQIIMGRWATTTAPSASPYYQWLFYFDSSNKLNFLHCTDSTTAAGTPLQSTTAITDTSAHHIEIVNNSGSLSLYVDGVREAGPSAVGTLATVGDIASFIIGDYCDPNGAPGGSSPLFAVMGDWELASVARHTGSSFTVPTTPVTADGNTVALLPMSSLAGNYISGVTFQGRALLRTGYSQASGGWANPDGPLPMTGGGWYFSVSAFNGTRWTCWAVTHASLETLLSGGGTLGAAAIQTPSTGEGDIAANGSVVPWGGAYHHYYHDESQNLRHASGSDLGAPFSPQPGTILFTGYNDPFVRPSADGSTLVMYMGKQTGATTFDRSVFVSTCTNSDGVTGWTTPTAVVGNLKQAGWATYAGEFAYLSPLAGATGFGFSDGATASGQPRRILGWATTDTGTSWLPLGMLIDATGTGNDAGGNPYLACYDTSSRFDSASGDIIFLGTLSTNSQPTQPTDSDIGYWRFSVTAGSPFAAWAARSSILIGATT